MGNFGQAFVHIVVVTWYLITLTLEVFNCGLLLRVSQIALTFPSISKAQKEFSLNYTRVAESWSHSQTLYSPFTLPIKSRRIFPLHIWQTHSHTHTHRPLAQFIFWPEWKWGTSKREWGSSNIDKCGSKKSECGSHWQRESNLRCEREKKQIYKRNKIKRKKELSKL